MKPVTVFGLDCSPEDEPQIVARVNLALAKLKRCTSKATQKSLLDGLRPFVHKHYHWNLNRDCGVYFELLQNRDLRGEFHYPGNPGMALLLIFVLQEQAYRKAAPRKKALAYVSRILASVGVGHELVADGPDREGVEATMLQQP